MHVQIILSAIVVIERLNTLMTLRFNTILDKYIYYEADHVIKSKMD